jgi:hypothetical protein
MRQHKTRFRVFTAGALVFASAALLMAASAGAATVRVAISGSFTLTEPTGPTTIGVGLAGVEGDQIYTGIGTSNDTGTVTITMPSAPPFPGAIGPGATLTAFHGDVSQGCFRVQGNQAIVVGHLPANEQFDVNFGLPTDPQHIEWVGTRLEDNGVATGTPVDRGNGIFFRTASGTSTCNPTTSGWLSISMQALDAGDASIGYTDRLDGYPANPDTDVTVTDANGLSVTITDATDPNGLNVVVGAGSGKAKLNACGGVVNVTAGSTAILTCASLIVEVVVGSAEVELEVGLSFVSIPEGGKAEIADDGSGGFIVENLATEPITVNNFFGTQPITVIVDGVSGTILPGKIATVESWDFQGFTGRDGPPALNKASAGSTVSLKWRVVDAAGAPVTDLSAATITVNDIDCTTRADLGNVQPGQTAGSLQNLGDGYYQLNWKTLKSYVGCKAMHLDIGDGVTHDAFFNFTK